MMEFHYEIKPIPYRNEDMNVSTNQTAEVTMVKNNGNDYEMHSFGYRTSDEIYEEFNRSGTISLDCCFIDDGLTLENRTIKKVRASKAFLGGEIKFSNSVIEEPVDFVGTIFAHDTYFLNTTFLSKVDLSLARIYGEMITFSGAEFQKSFKMNSAKFFCFGNFISTVFMESSWRNTEFSRSASFWYARFLGLTDMYETQFNGRVKFDNATFLKKANFSYASFTDAEFNDVTFKEEVTFQHAKVERLIELRHGCFYSTSLLTFKVCRNIILDDSMFEKLCTLSANMHCDSISLYNCVSLGQFSVQFNDKVKQAINADNKVFTDKVIKNGILAQQYNFLKVNYYKNGEYEYEDQAYVEYRRCLRKTRKSFIRFFDWLLLDKISCYCTKPFQVFRVAIITILAFALLFHLSTILPFVSDAITFSPNMVIQISNSATSAPEIITQTTSNYEGIGGCFYHSLITFFTIGYGDSRPLGLLGLILTGLEGFIGVFLMSLFTVSFVRKALR